MRNKRMWTTAAIVAAILIGAWVVYGIVDAGRGTPPLPSSQTGISLKGGHVQGNRISTRSWSFDYSAARLSPDGTTGTVDGVRNGIVLRKGKPYLRVAAQHISIDTNSLNFTAIGKVHVEMIDDPQKRSFDTDLVVWTNGAKLLRMDHPSYIHTEGSTLKLSSVTIDFATDQVHLSGINGDVEVHQ